MKTVDERLLVRLRAVEDSYEETLTELADQGILADQNRYREVSTRHSELKPVVDAFRKYVETST